jgi:hypothetical protein
MYGQDMAIMVIFLALSTDNFEVKYRIVRAIIIINYFTINAVHQYDDMVVRREPSEPRGLQEDRVTSAHPHLRTLFLSPKTILTPINSFRITQSQPLSHNASRGN